MPLARIARPLLLATGLATGLALGAAGCGPVQYLRAIANASEAVERAREAGASERAAYDYWYASAHLEKAREEAFESAYQDAVRHARVAEEHARRAEERASQTVPGPSRPPAARDDEAWTGDRSE